MEKEDFTKHLNTLIQGIFKMEKNMEGEYFHKSQARCRASKENQGSKKGMKEPGKKIDSSKE